MHDAVQASFSYERHEKMDKFKFTLALLCIIAAFVLLWRHIDGGSMFLTLLAGSPLEGGLRKVAGALSKPADAPADPTSNE